jgi:predicted aspartyl protease
MAAIPETGGEMGKVYTDIMVRNADDVRRAERGDIEWPAVREVRLRHVLADSGATTLCLAAPLIVQLGLPIKDYVEVTTAAGVRATNLYYDARIELEGRWAVVECLELPGGAQALLGVFPLELLGIERDLANESLRLLHTRGPETHLTIL